MVKKTSHYYNIFFVDSRPTISDTLCKLRRGAVSGYVVRVIIYNSMYHLLSTSAAYDPAKIDMLENRKIFPVSLTPSRYYMKNTKLGMSHITTWDVQGDF